MMNVARGRIKTTNIVEKAAIRAPSLPTYGYHMASDIGGRVMKNETNMFLLRDNLISF